MLKDISERLQDFHRYYSVNRAVGHTKAVIDAAKENPNLIIIAQHNLHAELFRRLLKSYGLNNKVISSFETDQLLGLNNPVMFDNSTLDIIFFESLNKINKLEKRLKELTTREL